MSWGSLGHTAQAGTAQLSLVSVASLQENDPSLAAAVVNVTMENLIL